MTRGVLVTGATGFLGRHLLGALRVAGASATALVRDRAAWPYRPDEVGDVAIVEGDPGESAWHAATGSIGAIVHAAGIVRHTRRDPDEMIRVNVETTLQIVRAAQLLGARVVLISSSGTVGCFRHADRFADEHAPYAASMVARWPYYHSKLRAECAARRLADQLGVELVIARLPVLLGPGDHRLRSTGHVTRVLAGRVPFVPSGGISFADVRDVATAIARLATESPARAIYHLPGTSVSLAAFFQMVREVSGAAITHRRAGPMLLDAIAWATRGLPIHGIPDPVVLEMASHHWGLTSLWSQAELGYASRAPRQTLVDTVAWLRAHHPELADRRAAQNYRT